MRPYLRSSLRQYVCSSCQQNILRTRRRNFASDAKLSHDIADVVLVGGGPVGLALLAALKSSPVTSHLKVALIETQVLSRARGWDPPPDAYSNRASSLTPTSISFLSAAGAWNHVDQARIQPYDRMEVWDGGNDSSLQFDHQAEARRYNAPARSIATMVENANLTKGLLHRISELDAESSLVTETSVTSIEHGTNDPGGLNLSAWPLVNTLSAAATSFSSIAARLLVGADGFNSPVRNFAWIPSMGWDYDRHAVVATLSTEAKAESYDSVFHSNSTFSTVAYQRFLPDLGGPVALLPLPNSKASLVWSTTPQNAAYLKALPAESFVALVNAAFSLDQVDIKYLFSLPPPSSSQSSPFTYTDELNWRLQHALESNASPSPPLVTAVQPDTVSSFPLRLRHAGTYIAPRIALVGDAAHTIHPLAGQGLNLGLADAQSLFSTIEYAVQHGQDLGDVMTLERYNNDRWSKNLAMAMGVDGLNSVYQAGAGSDGLVGRAIGRIRGIGVDIFGSASMAGVRGWVMRYAE